MACGTLGDRMSEVVFTDKFFADIAGWEAMKMARASLQLDKVLSSNWTPPILKGVVQEGTTSYRAGLVIKNSVDIENLCTCRASREWGTICSHSVAVGLHYLKSLQPASTQASKASKTTAISVASQTGTSPAPTSPGKVLLRGGESAESLELFFVLPPSFEQAVARGKIMVCFEGKWRAGRMPLNALPKHEPFTLSVQDSAVLDLVETLAGGETPAMLMLGPGEFARLLPLLSEHPGITLGKSTAVSVQKDPVPLAIKATLEPNGEIVLGLKEKPAA
ncbi:MAG TPA: hypothetical protein VMZ27_18510, partial [Candidatus Saccharimonadales bacterium]|nr:hypothetical protein [Candidatus Saccharimonadales bacterium]